MGTVKVLCIQRDVENSLFNGTLSTVVTSVKMERISEDTLTEFES